MRVLVLASVLLAAAEASAGPPVVLLVGDSLGVGLGRQLRVRAAHDGCQLHQASVSGTTTEYWSTRLRPLVREVRPVLVLASLGTNDALTSRLTDHHEFVDRVLEAADVPLVWIGLPRLPGSFVYERPVHDLIQSKAEFYFNSSRIWMYREPDQIHFTAKGYEIWADQIWDGFTGRGWIIAGQRTMGSSLTHEIVVLVPPDEERLVNSSHFRLRPAWQRAAILSESRRGERITNLGVPSRWIANPSRWRHVCNAVWDSDSFRQEACPECGGKSAIRLTFPEDQPGPFDLDNPWFNR